MLACSCYALVLCHVSLHYFDYFRVCFRVFGVLTQHSIGKNIQLLLMRQDEPWCFRLHKDRVYYASENLVRKAGNVQRKQLLSIGVCFGKFSRKGKFQLHITSLDLIAPYAKVKTSLRSALCALRSALCALRSALCALRSALCALRSALCALRSALCALRSALCALRSALCALRSALCALRSALCACRCADGVQFKIWVKPSSEQSYLYGNHLLKAGLGRITENTPE